MSENPSKQQFAESLMDAIRAVDDSHEYVHEAEEFRLTRVEQSGAVNLSNMYVEHCKLPDEERAAHLQRLASIIAGEDNELPDDYSEVRAHLRPKIWARSTIDFHKLHARIEGEKAIRP